MGKYEEKTNRLYTEFDRATLNCESRRDLRKIQTLATKCLSRVTQDGGDYIRRELAKTEAKFSA